MKTIFLICLLSAATLHTASADIPKKAPLVKYTGLWTNSPFTSKPVVDSGGTTANPIDDYTLTGIAPVPGGYRITIMNKKDPTKKVVIEPGVSDSEFKVVSVDRNPGKVLGTTVVLASGSIQGTVSFEPDLITLKSAPVAPPKDNPPGIPLPGTAPITTQPGNGDNTQRQPRPRIVPAPTPTSSPPQGTAPQNGNRGDRTNRRR